MLLHEPAMTALTQRVLFKCGISFLIVKHGIPAVMNISDKIMVRHFGRKIAGGMPVQLQADEAVVAAYLGISHGVAVAS